MTNLDQKAWAEAVRHVHDGNPLWIALADNALSTEGARALIAAYLAALPPSPAVVADGWKLVPVEADEAMIGAGVNEAHRQGGSYAASAIYRAMLTASPSPPALDGAGRDAVIEECAKVADDRTPSKFGGPLASHVTGRAIAAAIRSLKETP